jgi:hypothetical protein
MPKRGPLESGDIEEALGAQARSEMIDCSAKGRATLFPTRSRTAPGQGLGGFAKFETGDIRQGDTFNTRSL